MTAGNIARHRNYGELMERHERDQKWRRLFKVFIYFLVAAFFIIIFIIVIRWEKRASLKTASILSSFTSASPPWLS